MRAIAVIISQYFLSQLLTAQTWPITRGCSGEEEAFLTDPAAVFDSGHYRVLREIQQRIGLEFFGINCGLDGSGNLVVFEANASMPVHDKNEEFPYKAPFVHRIKSAFDEMLRKFAGRDPLPD